MPNSQPSNEATGDEDSEVGEGKVEGEGKSEVVVRLQPAAISFINVKLARVIILPGSNVPANRVVLNNPIDEFVQRFALRYVLRVLLTFVT